jgi:hypothetical protein
MVLTAFALLLLSAEPDPSFAVVATATPGLERAASTAAATLATRLETQYVELGGYLKTTGPGCQADLRCLTAAPGLTTTTRLLHLRVRPLSGGRLAADLRLIQRANPNNPVATDRSAAIVEPGDLATWAEQAATRIFTRASAAPRQAPSAFTAPPVFSSTTPAAPASPPPPPPAAKPPPTAPASPATQPKGVRGTDDEP